MKIDDKRCLCGDCKNADVCYVKQTVVDAQKLLRMLLRTQPVTVALFVEECPCHESSS